MPSHGDKSWNEGIYPRILNLCVRLSYLTPEDETPGPHSRYAISGIRPTISRLSSQQSVDIPTELRNIGIILADTDEN